MDTAHHKNHLSHYLRSHKESSQSTSRNGPSVSSPGATSKGNNTPPDVRPGIKSTDGVAATSASPKRAAAAAKPGNAPVSGGARSKQTTTSRPAHKPTTASLFSSKLAYSCQRRPTVDYLPDEVLLKIFSYMGPEDLLLASRVCRRWSHLGNDHFLWQKIHKKYAVALVKGNKAGGIPLKPTAAYWKSLCIEKGAKYRNSKALPLLKKLSPFTGLPANTQQALQKAGVRWVLCLVDSDGVEHCSTFSDVFYFSMSVCVRWNSLNTPTPPRLRKLRLYAANPVFFDSKGQPIANSPCQKSLLYECEFRWSQMATKLTAMSQDDIVNVYSLPDGLLVATWKDGCELAFVSASLPVHQLVLRCLQGRPDRYYLPAPHKVLKDDIDSKYGLHGYTCTMELRNQRKSFWSQQWRNLYCGPDFSDGCGVVQLIDPENNYDRSGFQQKVSLTWKTDALKGRVPDLCFLDLVLIDECSKQPTPMWCVSSLVKVESPKKLDGTNYDFDGDNYHIHYEDAKGKVHAKLVWEAETDQYFIIGLHLYPTLPHINRWFGTRY